MTTTFVVMDEVNGFWNQQGSPLSFLSFPSCTTLRNVSMTELPYVDKTIFNSERWENDSTKIYNHT